VKRRVAGVAAAAIALTLVACGGRTDAHVVDDLVDRLLAGQLEALQLAVETWDGVADPLTVEVDRELEEVLAGRALARARITLPTAVGERGATLPDADVPTRIRRFATERLVRSEPRCVVAVGRYRFAGLDTDDGSGPSAAVSLSAISPDGALGEVRHWRLRDVISMASYEDADLSDPDVLDTTCTWDP
jgi:hypothetical protein